MRIGIVGSRGFPDLQAVRRYVATLPPDTVIVTGGAQGVDMVAESEARLRSLSVVVIPAQWDRYGNKAGPLRNTELVRAIDRLVAFWDGESTGTRHAIAVAEQAKVPVVVYRP
jgi:hypothetical protein